MLVPAIRISAPATEYVLFIINSYLYYLSYLREKCYPNIHPTFEEVKLPLLHTMGNFPLQREHA